MNLSQPLFTFQVLLLCLELHLGYTLELAEYLDEEVETHTVIETDERKNVAFDALDVF